MYIALLMLGALFASFFLVGIGLSAWSMLEVRIKSIKIIGKELTAYELLEDEDPETFNKIERYKNFRFITAVVIVALLLLLMLYLLGV